MAIQVVALKKGSIHGELTENSAAIVLTASEGVAGSFPRNNKLDLAARPRICAKSSKCCDSSILPVDSSFRESTLP